MPNAAARLSKVSGRNRYSKFVMISGSRSWRCAAVLFSESAPVPPELKREVQRRAQKLIDSTLKPRDLQPPSPETEIQLPGGPLLPKARPFFLLRFDVLFARAPRAFALLRVKVCPTSIRGEWAL
jgi:hypothetical protein